MVRWSAQMGQSAKQSKDDLKDEQKMKNEKLKI